MHGAWHSVSGNAFGSSICDRSERRRLDLRGVVRGEIIVIDQKGLSQLSEVRTTAHLSTVTLKRRKMLIGIKSRST